MENQNRASRYPLVACIYSEVMNTLLTVSSHDARLWDYDTGRLLSCYEPLVGGNCEVTCATMDRDARKFFVGCSDGRVISYNYTNGLKVPSLPLQGGQAQGNDAQHTGPPVD